MSSGNRHKNRVDHKITTILDIRGFFKLNVNIYYLPFGNLRPQDNYWPHNFSSENENIHSLLNKELNIHLKVQEEYFKKHYMILITC